LTTEEFDRWLENLQRSGDLTDEETFDLQSQRRVFDERRSSLIGDFQGRVVAFPNNEILIADSVSELLGRAQESYGRPIYFEPIGYDPF